MPEARRDDPTAGAEPAVESALRRLAASAQTGDRAALDEFVRRLLPAVRASVEAELGERLRRVLDVEDVAQCVLLDVHRALPRLDLSGGVRLHAWIRRIVRNEIHDLAARHGAAKRADARRVYLEELEEQPEAGDVGVAEEDAASPPALVDSGPEVPDQAALAEIREMIERIIDSLPRPESVMLRLVELEGTTLVEAARRLALPRTTASRLYRTALARLGRRLGARRRDLIT
jgi:RNA polymerase sigma factor (sigma-70 family)